MVYPGFQLQFPALLERFDGVRSGADSAGILGTAFCPAVIGPYMPGKEPCQMRLVGAERDFDGAIPLNGDGLCIFQLIVSGVLFLYPVAERPYYIVRIHLPFVGEIDIVFKGESILEAVTAY